MRCKRSACCYARTWPLPRRIFFVSVHVVSLRYVNVVFFQESISEFHVFLCAREGLVLKGSTGSGKTEGSLFRTLARNIDQSETPLPVLNRGIIRIAHASSLALLEENHSTVRISYGAPLETWDLKSGSSSHMLA
jgi:hypothetical protein